ncbi:OmpH family outer membrane protein [Urechidicola croceus]|uniref:Molecular chaperone Skp n=1 Tax=Urechidicola croceus TaxID=1850246 RepID=A0A1D8P4X4_9FLAO|nr:OmpH family outer membrane protein [Urechidicola croceus]AOW19652.1 hypothetical protein LPB138_02690 [Urechidicola croceus]
MKKTNLIRISVLVILLFFSVNLSAQTIAYVDSDNIIASMPEYKQARASLVSFGKTLQKNYEARQKDFTDYYALVLDKANKGILTPIEQQGAENKIKKMQEDLELEVQKLDNEVLKKESELIKPVYDKFNRALDKVSNDNNYMYIIDKKMLLHSRNGIDATYKVRAILGI